MNPVLRIILGAGLFLSVLWTLAYVNSLTPDNWLRYWWGFPATMTEGLVFLGAFIAGMLIAMPVDDKKKKP